jgi:hypothetical protein
LNRCRWMTSHPADGGPRGNPLNAIQWPYYRVTGK